MIILLFEVFRNHSKIPKIHNETQIKFDLKCIVAKRQIVKKLVRTYTRIFIQSVPVMMKST